MSAQRDLSRPLTVAISSRALFDLDESNRVYEEQGLEAYRLYQIQNEDRVLEPGEGFALVKKILKINELLEKPRVDVILLSRNSADTGLRIFNSIQAHGLSISRRRVLRWQPAVPLRACVRQRPVSVDAA